MISPEHIANSIFDLKPVRSYLEGNDYAAYVFYISRSPARRSSDEKHFVIFEQSSTMGHPTRYQAHFYKTKELLLEAFSRGLIKMFTDQLNSEPKPFTTLQEFVQEVIMEEGFRGCSGYINTLESTSNDEKRFWFLCQDPRQTIHEGFCNPV